MGTTYGYIGFPAPVINIKSVCLYKTRLSGCGQTEHDFSHRYYFSHTYSFGYYQSCFLLLTHTIFLFDMQK